MTKRHVRSYKMVSLLTDPVPLPYPSRCGCSGSRSAFGEVSAGPPHLRQPPVGLFNILTDVGVRLAVVVAVILLAKIKLGVGNL